MPSLQEFNELIGEIVQTTALVVVRTAGGAGNNAFMLSRDGEDLSFGKAPDSFEQFQRSARALLEDGGEALCQAQRRSGNKSTWEPYVFSCKRDGTTQKLGRGDICPAHEDAEPCPFHDSVLLEAKDCPDLQPGDLELFNPVTNIRRALLDSLAHERCIDAVLAQCQAALAAPAADPAPEAEAVGSAILMSATPDEPGATPDDRLRLVEEITRACERQRAVSLTLWLMLHGFTCATLEPGELRDPQPDQYRRLASVQLPADTCFIDTEDFFGHPTEVTLDDGTRVGVHGAFICRHQRGLLSVTPLLSIVPGDGVRRLYPVMGYGVDSEPEVEGFWCERYTDCRAECCYDSLSENTLAGSRLQADLAVSEEICDALLASIMRKAPPPPPRRALRAKRQKRRSR